FSIVDAHPIGEVLAALERGAKPGSISMRAALQAIPEVEIEPLLVDRLRHGDSRALDHLGPEGAGLFKVVSRRQLIAIARRTSPVASVIIRVFDVQDASRD